MALKPICVPCQRFFRVQRNGFAFIEQFPFHPGAVPGTLTPELWRPYKLWSGDLWECQGCKAKIISGTGSKPVSEHFLDDFKEQVTLRGASLKVNDC